MLQLPLVVQLDFNRDIDVMESGLVTLTYIVGVLVSCVSAIPLLLLFAPGTERGEPKPESDSAGPH